MRGESWKIDINKDNHAVDLNVYHCGELMKERKGEEEEIEMLMILLRLRSPQILTKGNNRHNERRYYCVECVDVYHCELGKGQLRTETLK